MPEKLSMLKHNMENIGYVNYYVYVDGRCANK